MDKLTKYVVSLANLNGLIHKDIVLDIYNYMNDEKISKEDVEEYFKEGREFVTEKVYTIDPYFIQGRIWYFKHLTRAFIDKQRNFYYVPSEEKLFKYLDYHYIEKTKAYWNLYEYAGKIIFADDWAEAKFLCEEIFKRLQFGISPDGILWYELEELGIEFIDEEQRQFLKVLMEDFSLDIRKWLNNGYTDRELNRTFTFKGNKKSVISFKISKDLKVEE